MNTASSFSAGAISYVVSLMVCMSIAERHKEITSYLFIGLTFVGVSIDPPGIFEWCPSEVTEGNKNSLNTDQWASGVGWQRSENTCQELHWLLSYRDVLCQLLLFRCSVWVSKYLISPGDEVSFYLLAFLVYCFCFAQRSSLSWCNRSSFLAINSWVNLGLGLDHTFLSNQHLLLLYCALS